VLCLAGPHDAVRCDERRRAQEAKEYAAYQSAQNQKQRMLDAAWEQKLWRDAERAYRRARVPDERLEKGKYSLVARFEREMRGE